MEQEDSRYEGSIADWDGLRIDLIFVHTGFGISCRVMEPLDGGD